jgi:dihydropteroate synthase
MGIINCSHESFYIPSIKISSDNIFSYTKKLEKEGADIIDLGGMSTAPYLNSLISPEKEIKRLVVAIKAIKKASDLPLSIDTPRAIVAENAINCGVEIVNDVCGLKYDDKMGEIVSKYGVKIIMGAYLKKQHISITGDIKSTTKLLHNSINIAIKSGIKKKNIIIDPSIGFFRQEGKNPFFTKINIPWYLRDLRIISDIKQLTKLHFPLCISISSKSFLGELLNLKPEERIIPSLILEAHAIINGTSIIRTHNVKHTAQMLKVLNRFDSIAI